MKKTLFVMISVVIFNSKAEAEGKPVKIRSHNTIWVMRAAVALMLVILSIGTSVWILKGNSENWSFSIEFRKSESKVEYLKEESRPLYVEIADI